jgi:TPR repeat protein
MKTRFLGALTLWLVAGWGSSSQAQDARPIVAVFEVQDKGSRLSASQVDRLTDYLVTLVTGGGYQVVPRAQLRERLQDQKRGSYKACYDERCQIELGRELAAQKTLSGQVLRFGKTCKVTVGLFDLARSASERAGSHSGGCSEEEIVASLERAVQAMVQGGADSGEAASGEAEVMERTAAYQRGEREHAYDIGMAYLNGWMGAPKSYVKAKEWFAKAAAHGDVEAFVALGDRYAWGQGTRTNHAEALKWYRKAADAGNPLGQEKLADRYFHAEGLKRNYTEAARWYRKACEGGQRAEPCQRLGTMVLSGEGVKKDAPEAVRLLVLAEERGSTASYAFLATIYMGGHPGVPEDTAKALTYLEHGAKEGYEPAMFDLARAYAGEHYPKLTEPDLVVSYMWLLVYFEKETSPEHAAELRKKLEARLPPADRERARSEAAALIERLVTPRDREDKAYLRTLPGR